MTALFDTHTLTEGVIDKLPADAYHALPGLSSTGARRLLPPSCPALFEHERRNGRQHRRQFDIGHAAHMLVLGEGPALVTVDADDYRSKSAREARDQAYQDGAVPLLPHEYAEVQAMAEAIRRHPIAGSLFAPGSGRAEQSLMWRDKPTGVWRRARPDWMKRGAGRLLVVDYKTTASASPDDLPRTIHTYGYHQQAAWYLDGVSALGLADDSVFVFCFQEKRAPYLVTVIELDALALQIGRDLNRRAIDLYNTCENTGVWPGYSDRVETVCLPPWAENKHLEESS